MHQLKMFRIESESKKKKNNPSNRIKQRIHFKHFISLKYENAYRTHNYSLKLAIFVRSVERVSCCVMIVFAIGYLSVFIVYFSFICIYTILNGKHMVQFFSENCTKYDDAS